MFKVTKIQELMNSLPDDIDAGIITSSENRRYFLDFLSSAGTIFVTRKKAYFIIDFRYIEAAKKTVTGFEIMLQKNLSDQINQLIIENNVKTIALENTYISFGEYLSLKNNIENAEINSNNSFDQIIIDMRKIKSEYEIKRMREAQRLTDETFSYIINNIKAGMTEKEIALDMEFFMRKQGADAVSFSFIVVSGKNSSKPHGVPSDNIVKAGDFITMDFGGIVDGYCSDMTRTVAVGNISDKQRFVYDTVLESQLKSIEYIKPGLVCEDVDKVARDIIYRAGFEGKFGHGLGHSLGIEIHESPRFAIAQKDILQAGMVMTVEPGIYLEDEFGVRIEDMGVVTDSGIDIFTKSSKELIVL